MGDGDVRCDYHLQLAMPLSKALFYGAMGYISYLARVRARFEQGQQKKVETKKEILARKKEIQKDLAALGEKDRNKMLELEEQIAEFEKQITKLDLELTRVHRSSTTNDEMENRSGLMYMRLEGRFYTKRFEYKK